MRNEKQEAEFVVFEKKRRTIFNWFSWNEGNERVGKKRLQVTCGVV